MSVKTVTVPLTINQTIIQALENEADRYQIGDIVYFFIADKDKKKLKEVRIKKGIIAGKAVGYMVLKQKNELGIKVSYLVKLKGEDIILVEKNENELYNTPDDVRQAIVQDIPIDEDMDTA